MTRTTLAKAPDNGWLITDATDVPLGRLASSVAVRLMGKHKPTYTPHIDTGDHVVVTNAAAVKMTGTKLDTKTYDHYTGYNNGLKTRRAKDMMEQDPTEVVTLAIRRMLPKGPMGKRMIRKLHVVAGADHPHKAQAPQSYTVDLKGAAK